MASLECFSQCMKPFQMKCNAFCMVLNIRLLFLLSTYLSILIYFIFFVVHKIKQCLLHRDILQSHNAVQYIFSREELTAILQYSYFVIVLGKKTVSSFCLPLFLIVNLITLIPSIFRKCLAYLFLAWHTLFDYRNTHFAVFLCMKSMSCCTPLYFPICSLKFYINI